MDRRTEVPFLPHDRNLGMRFIMRVQKFGGPSPKEIGGQKHAKFGPISYNFRLRSRISPERDKISKIGKRNDRERFLPRSPKKFGELWSTNYRVMDVSLEAPKLNFSGDYISALRGCGPSNFNRHYRLSKVC